MSASINQAPPSRIRLTGAIVKNVRELSVLPGLVALVIVGAFVSTTFLTGANIQLIFRQSAELGIVVIGLVFIVITSKLDISLESTMGIAPMIGAWLMVSPANGGLGAQVGPALGIVITLAVGALIGLINGLLVVKLKLDSFIVTLAMLILLRGITTGISQGSTLSSLPAGYIYLGTANWFGIPAAIWVTGILFVLAALVLRYHRWGRALFAIGGNEDAAKAAGIKVDRTLIIAFVVGSTLAALAGMLLAGRLYSVTANMGQNEIFSALAATVIGGIQLAGGKGRILGAVLGVLLLGTLTNVLTLAGVATFWINAVYGFVILLALFVGRFAGNKS
jgi:ribose/xylose/arabinose/galactoside ABC-type transport system permease subunit